MHLNILGTSLYVLLALYLDTVFPQELQIIKAFFFLCVIFQKNPKNKNVALGQKHHTLLDLNILSLDLDCDLEVGMDQRLIELGVKYNTLYFPTFNSSRLNPIFYPMGNDLSKINEKYAVVLSLLRTSWEFARPSGKT